MSATRRWLRPGATSTGDDVACGAGKLTLELDGREVVFDRDAIGLGALLPRHLVPDGARAVWTGRALLIARAVAGRLEIDGRPCRAGTLTRGSP